VTNGWMVNMHLCDEYGQWMDGEDGLCEDRKWMDGW
jgi:hypothetical protein